MNVWGDEDPEYARSQYDAPAENWVELPPEDALECAIVDRRNRLPRHLWGVGSRLPYNPDLELVPLISDEAAAVAFEGRWARLDEMEPRDVVGRYGADLDVGYDADEAALRSEERARVMRGDTDE